MKRSRAIRYTEAHDLVGWNGASLVDTPQGQAGRRSRSLTPELARDLFEVERRSRIYAYVVVTGPRTEEVRGR